MASFLAVASVSPECLVTLGTRSSLSPFTSITVEEGGAALAQMSDTGHLAAPFVRGAGHHRLTVLVGKTAAPEVTMERVMRAYLRYGKRMHRYLPKKLSYALFDGRKRQLFFACCYVSEENGAIWLASEETSLSAPVFAEVGFFRL
jgi:hypothetical protein